MSKVTQIRQRARAFLQKGKFDKAIEEYKRLTGMETKNPNYLNELGDIYLKAGDSIQAVVNFEKAVVNYEKVALYNNAVAVCKKILRIIPDRGDTLYKLGELRAKQKLGGEAVAHFCKYLDHMLANADTAGPELNERIDGILELVPESVQILEKASEALAMIGMKVGALEIYCKLCSDARETGGGDRIAAYEAKIDLLKQSMTSEEIGLVERAMKSAGESGGTPTRETGGVEPDMGEWEAGEEEQSAEEAACGPAIESEGMAEDEPAAETEEGEEPAPDEANDEANVDYVIEGMDSVPESESEIDSAVESSQAPEREEDGAPEMDMAEAGNDGEETPEQSQTESIDGEEPAMGHPDAKEEPEDAIPAGDGTAAEQDLSSLLDDVRNEDTAESLAEEITSDVEEDDFRSHYDLGMAYLEMALYTEAIKEFQIASRSDQIRIKSIEMIGHCFLMQNNPRLAVKQLMRGLELVKNADSESLGVHYNLGLAYEMLGDMEKAREHYEEVYIVDISFRDVADKMKKLSTVS